MTLRVELLPLLLALALASFTCRAGGFWLMRFVTVTPRLRAMLAAAPLAVMLGIVTPAALRGGLPEIAGLAVTFAAMRLWRSDLVAMFCGVAAVALCRGLLPQ
ncbi:MAG TPA: AzlD domain-containing protein [Burkholderiales bacterium]|nr:AzlD domain-containing protein [Burkholderiales bacterium]